MINSHVSKPRPLDTPCQDPGAPFDRGDTMWGQLSDLLKVRIRVGSSCECLPSPCSHQRSKPQVLEGTEWILVCGGVDLNYIYVCAQTGTCSTQQETGDRSSWGACLGLLLAGKPGQGWRAPTALPWLQPLWVLRCLLARALVGTVWLPAHSCG